MWPCSYSSDLSAADLLQSEDSPEAFKFTNLVIWKLSLFAYNTSLVKLIIDLQKYIRIVRLKILLVSLKVIMRFVKKTCISIVILVEKLEIQKKKLIEYWFVTQHVITLLPEALQKKACTVSTDWYYLSYCGSAECFVDFDLITFLYSYNLKSSKTERRSIQSQKRYLSFICYSNLLLFGSLYYSFLGKQLDDLDEFYGNFFVEWSISFSFRIKYLTWL